jgi:hypothetical protein
MYNSNRNQLRLVVQNTKLMVFKGQVSVICKIIIDNKVIEQVYSFIYLGYMICYGREVEDNKFKKVFENNRHY